MEGKTVDNVTDKLKEFKDLYYAKPTENDNVFFVIKRLEYFLQYNQ